MSLIDTLNQELQGAIRRKDSFTATVIRSVLTDIQNESVAGKSKKTLNDDQVTATIRKAIVSRQKAQEEYASLGATERANNEKNEIDVLSKFVPPPSQ